MNLKYMNYDEFPSFILTPKGSPMFFTKTARKQPPLKAN